MAKYYVQSGLFEIMVQAGDGEGAALWAVHRYLQACDQASQELFVQRQAGATVGPSAMRPSAVGPSAAGPSAAGPSAAGPSAAGPAPIGPAGESVESTFSLPGDPPDLAETIRCSEIGFGRRDGGVYLTSEVLQKYSELLHALASLGI